MGKKLNLSDNSEFYLAIHVIRKTRDENSQVEHEVIAEWDEDMLIKNTLEQMDVAFYGEFNVSKYTRHKDAKRLHELSEMYEDLKDLVRYAISHGIDQINVKAQRISFQDYQAKTKARDSVLKKAMEMVK